MGHLFVVLAALLAIFALVCQIVITAAGFKRSPLTGLLALVCFPFFTLYFAFARFQHPWKGTILAGWLGGFLLAIVLSAVGTNLIAATPPTP